MNITALEMAQASMEAVGCVICIMVAGILYINRKDRKSVSLFCRMFLITALILFSEACAYIFRGNTGGFSVAATAVSNFAVFLLNLFLGNAVVCYTYSLLKEKGVRPNPVFRYISNACVVAGAAILLINLCTGWMYYFDADNYYHRNIGWFFYTGVSVLCFVMGVIVLIRHRRSIRMSTLFTNAAAAIFPYIAILLQTWFYGISVTYIGVGICLFCMMIDYFIDRSNAEATDLDDELYRRRTAELAILFVIMVISISASVITFIISINRISSDYSERDSQTIAQMINDNVEKLFLKPIIVGKTMSKDSSLRGYMHVGSTDPTSVEAGMKEYLSSIKDGFEYQMAYAVNEGSKAYYTSDGICKYVDVEKDESDLWYKEFVESGEDWELNVDTDETNHWALSVFVNARVHDRDGRFLGTCGVGVEMGTLQDMLEHYEETYEVKINLVDKNGLVQVSHRTDSILKEVLPHDYLDKVDERNFYYESLPRSSRLTKYMEELGWYLVIEDNNPEKINVWALTLPSLIPFLLGLLIMVAFFETIRSREKKTMQALTERRRMSLTDEMTGLLNRRAYEEDGAELERTGKYKDVAILMLDVNGLKTANDTLGHAAGDELLIGSAHCMQTAFGAHGKVYRVGGDEFVAIMKAPPQKVQEAIATFDHLLANWKGTLVKSLSISKGVAQGEDMEGRTYAEVCALADTRMYEDKALYYQRTGIERRKQ